MKTISHAQLVKEAANWLRVSRGCSVVATELTTAISETPDAIGWGNQQSILVECKSNRADFLADARKPHRFGNGIGLERWFYAPEGLIKAADVPTGWGLLERKEFSVRYICRRTVNATARPVTIDLAMHERRLLISLAWRACQAASLIKPLSVTNHVPDYAFDLTPPTSGKEKQGT